MKKFIYILLLCVSVNYAQQDFSKDLNGIKKIQITTNTSVDISIASANKFVIKNLKNQTDKKAKGLTALYSKGVDNTGGYGFSITKEGDILKVVDLVSHFKRSSLTFQVPNSVSLHINAGSLGSIKAKGFSSELELKTSTGNITLTDVTGPITANSSTGEINVKFVKVNQTSPISIHSSTGDVDVTLPTSTKANLNLYSSMGTVYTDFDLKKISHDDMKVIGANRKITHQLNNGGVEIRLKSSTGNVYLRKK